MKPRSSRPPSAAGQQGAALLTAMIIVTLVSTLASAMVWQQWRAVQVESAERARAQASWILAGALDFALLILREDQRSVDKTTRLTEPWATPLAESRLSTFLSADNAADTGDDSGPEAFLSGTIADAQAKYNLINLVFGESDKKKQQLQILTRLCSLVGVDESVATQIATQLTAAYVAAQKSDGSSSPTPLQPSTVAQLAWLGIDAASIRALEPFVILIPNVTAPVPVNLNTASRELLAAITGADLGSAELVVQLRQRTPFKTRDEALKRLGVSDLGTLPLSTINVVTSDFFEVDGRLRFADHVVTQHSLVQRLVAPPYRKVLRREFVSTVEEFRVQ